MLPVVAGKLAVVVAGNLAVVVAGNLAVLVAGNLAARTRAFHHTLKEHEKHTVSFKGNTTLCTSRFPILK